MEARSHTTAAAPAKELAGATTKPEVTACGVAPSRMTMNKHSPPRRSCKVEAVSMRAPEDEEDGSAGAVLPLMMRLNEDRARLHYMPCVVLLSCPDISTSGSSMELCTTSIYTSAQWSHVLLPGSCLECQRFARSTSLVPQKRRRSTLYVMNAVTTGPPPSSQSSITQLSRNNGRSSKTVHPVTDPNSALEQLDIERGVCIPFRKYTPELVCHSTRRDEEIVPFRARQLRNLLCDLGPSFIKAGQVAFEIIEEELGQPMEKLFSRISSETIAAASLGQVYRATLRETGEDVAIKVLIYLIFRYIKEAGIDLDGFLTVGVSAALRQLLEFGLFHGDPHPGNIFAMRDGRIAYVDFGNVAVLSQVCKFLF
ncbi:hypothetical protein PR202_ga24463 [Eleusine coracana subsp. coracana]|uniref:ABC1 atypical kinase-like domain-containing protein n=1 Tax=Eleusine coracana subsp. coracana TaxID=191504 RepID=A0AAV5D803_ELECO|nr:hypothetical protein PR202_ga24463 [Eleusine coracana subsp. coracana]